MSFSHLKSVRICICSERTQTLKRDANEINDFEIIYKIKNFIFLNHMTNILKGRHVDILLHRRQSKDAVRNQENQLVS